MDFKELGIVSHNNILPTNVAEFITTNHYKHTSRSLLQKEVFSLWHEDLLVGAAIFGMICSQAGAAKHGPGALELRRFYLIDEAPRNTESWFLGACLRHIKKQRRYTKIVTFADPNNGHEGIIYKATNFKYVGVEKFRQQILRIGNRDVSMRQVYQKKNGVYMESALKYQEMKRQGLAKVILTKPKHCYEYNLEGK